MEQKYEMRDLTVLIPVRIESLVRLENTLAVVRYLKKHFDIHVTVLEADKSDNGILKKLLPQEVRYTFVKDTDPVFYRTKYINQMVSEVTTDYLAVWDADVLFPPTQVQDAVQQLRLRKCDFCYPYDGDFWDTSKLIREEYLEHEDISLLEELKDFMVAPYGLNMRGGAFLANTQKYKEAGMENLNFYGWGPEDWERYERWMNLGYRIGYAKGCLYHLSHPRDMNGTHNSSQQRMYSHYERFLAMYSSAEEIAKRMNLKDYKHE